MTRQSGVSILSFLLALLLASVSLAITAAIGSHLLRQTNQSEEFKSVMVDVFQGMDAAISDQWQDSGCRALSEPPTLQTLVNDYEVPASVLTSPYAISIAYRTPTGATLSWGIKVTVTLPDGLSGYSLTRAARAVADDVFITERTITLYKGVANINSQLQHQYFDGETGCMQEDYE
ncbi:hypothetical protein CGH72_08190 [Vibrio parahaemolyticus]|uniref:hypothetical protein n=1 Tax=Vibrio parahaemolyticus TaxID=670 RepID=UPI001122CB14|nr:hypothetical protein [Vibrio parahaemolyticus]TOK03281.1 hypothetical protein CGI25_25120 [Vibrio parahaemolyticus]TOK18425.1 hypothetical protein CGI23_24135 [Vibrio parahaemolyticus]TOM64894.1 hypothetical protein CGH73_20620 [Vibrio parahaemolyticus]TOM73591.1 hypothetical protein CGH72_08190 [Vibrio parahaemolyticus]TON03614.1 hypothetical protein CGH67_19800 [Vibrio parahaemolyticus]